MEIVVTSKLIGSEEILSTKTFKLKEKETIVLSSRKWEERVPVKRWFKVVGHKLVMHSKVILSIKLQTLSQHGFSFTIVGKPMLTAKGDVAIVKIPKQGDVYVLDVGNSISFITQNENPNEEINILVKE